MATLRSWLDRGALDALPGRLPDFTGDLAPYADRTRLTGLVRAILDAVPWSITGQERAVQVVAILTPLIDGHGSRVSPPVRTPHSQPVPGEAEEDAAYLRRWAECVHNDDRGPDWTVAPEIAARADRVGIAIDPESEIATAEAIRQHYANNQDERRREEAP